MIISLPSHWSQIQNQAALVIRKFFIILSSNKTSLLFLITGPSASPWYHENTIWSKSALPLLEDSHHASLASPTSRLLFSKLNNSNCLLQHMFWFFFSHIHHNAKIPRELRSCPIHPAIIKPDPDIQ